MSDFKMTPGPWSRDWIYGGIRHLNKNVDDDAFFSDCSDDYERVENGELNTPNVRNNPGDADLIAAAPDLLEALKGVVRVADRATVEFDAARKAIAKATVSEP